MKYKYVVFDFDGTLADTEDIVFTIYLDLADKFKLKKVSKDELYKLKKLSAFEAIDHLDIKKWDLPGLLRRGRKVLHGMIENIDLCKDNMKNVLLDPRQILTSMPVKFSLASSTIASEISSPYNSSLELSW